MSGDNDRQIILTEKQLRLVIKESVHDALISLGIQDAEPIEMQKDFQLLRELRISTQAAKRKGLVTIVSAIYTGIVVLVVIGIKTYF